MADQNPSKKDRDNAADESLREKQQTDRSDRDSEWLRDQTGEDRNLSGSSTYRTLPDQPDDSEANRHVGDSKDPESDR